MTSGGNNFNHFGENQLIKFNARDAGDFNDAAGEWEMAPKCGSLLRNVGDLVDLKTLIKMLILTLQNWIPRQWSVVATFNWKHRHQPYRDSGRNTQVPAAQPRYHLAGLKILSGIKCL